MKYEQTLILKNGKTCTVRHGTYADGAEALRLFERSLTETDFLLSCPGETGLDEKGESEFLQSREESDREIMLLAETDGRIVGMAGLSAVGAKHKVRHRADVSVNVAEAYWGLGIGRALMQACIVCAARAGYRQAELEVVADNVRAVELYESLGFAEYGRNPLGFLSGLSGPQALIYMRREL